MARRPRASSKTSPHKSNGLDPNIVKSITERYDALDEQLASAKGIYMKAAQTVAEGRKNLLTEAKSRGINPKAFKSEIRCRNLGYKIAAERAALEGEDSEQAELIRDAIALLSAPLNVKTADQKKAEDVSLADSLTGDDDDGDPLANGSTSTDADDDDD